MPCGLGLGVSIIMCDGVRLGFISGASIMCRFRVYFGAHTNANHATLRSRRCVTERRPEITDYRTCTTNYETNKTILIYVSFLITYFTTMFEWLVRRP